MRSPKPREREAARAVPISRAWLFWIGLALAAATVSIYPPVGRYPFVGFDDLQYVAENPHVTSGLTWDGVRWAFTSGEQGAHRAASTRYAPESSSITFARSVRYGFGCLGTAVLFRLCKWGLATSPRFPRIDRAPSVASRT